MLALIEQAAAVAGFPRGAFDPLDWPMAKHEREHYLKLFAILSPSGQPIPGTPLQSGSTGAETARCSHIDERSLCGERCRWRDSRVFLAQQAAGATTVDDLVGRGVRNSDGLLAKH